MRWKMTALVLVASSCGPPRTFEVPSGTRGAVLTLEAEGAGVFEDFELFEPGAKSASTPATWKFVNGRQHSLVAGLTTPYRDVPAGTWRIETPRYEGELKFELLSSTAPADGTLRVDLRFLILSRCVDDENRVVSLIEEAVAGLEPYFFFQDFAVGSVTIERGVDLGVDCALADLWFSDLERFGEGDPPFTFVVSSSTLVAAGREVSGFAPLLPLPSRYGRRIGGLQISSRSAVGAVSHLLGHELGHFMGLQHVVERDGTTGDLLEDTPACEDPTDPDRDGQASGSECGAPSFNLMFWYHASPGIQLLSESQIDVMRRAVGLRGP